MSDRFTRFPAGEEIAPSCFAPITTDDWKRIQTSMRRRVSGAFTSIKMNAALPWRRAVERDLLYVLEVDPDVDSIQVLPHQVVVMVEEKERRHFPSFQIRTGGRVAVFDALTSREDADPARRMLTAALKAVYLRQGIWYRAFPAHEIRLEPRFSNVKFILKSKGHTPDQETIRRVIEVLSDGELATIAEIKDALSDREHVSETVCAMALSQMINLNKGAAEPMEMEASLRLQGLF